MRQNSKGSEGRHALCLNGDAAIRCFSKSKGGKNLKNGFLRITSSANWAAILRSMIDVLLSLSILYRIPSPGVIKLSKVTIACKAGKQENNSKNEILLSKIIIAING